MKQEYGVPLTSDPCPLTSDYGAVLVAVAHDEFKALDYSTVTQAGTIIFDLKGILPEEVTSTRL